MDFPGQPCGQKALFLQLLPNGLVLWADLGQTGLVGLQVFGQLGDRCCHVLPVRLEADRTSPGLQNRFRLAGSGTGFTPQSTISLLRQKHRWWSHFWWYQDWEISRDILTVWRCFTNCSSAKGRPVALRHWPLMLATEVWHHSLTHWAAAFTHKQYHTWTHFRSGTPAHTHIDYCKCIVLLVEQPFTHTSNILLKHTIIVY